MKIGLFLENFTDTEIKKDPGIIAKGLMDTKNEIYVFSNKATARAKKELNIKEINKWEYASIKFWKETGVEVIIFYSWLSLRYSKTIEALKNAGIKVILKLDSDGNLLYPNIPSYLRVFGVYGSLSSKLIHCIRLIQWYLFPKIISRKKIAQIDSSNAIIIETPTAKEILVKSLIFWGREDLVKKIQVIPNPVCVENKTDSKKLNMITCIGRWDDKRKNATGLWMTLSQLTTSWQVTLIGKGSDKIATKIKTKNKSLNITTFESLPHEKIMGLLAETKILFSPSVSESFGLVVAEALCQGCSLVCGDLPSFKYFISKGENGTLSSGFSPAFFTQAILMDIEKWESGLYNPKEIQNNWQNTLDPKNIVLNIENLIKKIKW